MSDDPAAVLSQYEICSAVVGTLRQDLERLRTPRPWAHPGERILEHHLAMLEQLKTGDVAAIDAAEPVANLVIARGCAHRDGRSR